MVGAVDLLEKRFGHLSIERFPDLGQLVELVGLSAGQIILFGKVFG